MSSAVGTGSVVSSLVRVFTAGEKLLIEQAELIRLDSREKIASVATRIGLVAVGGVFLFTAWIGVLITFVVAVDSLTLEARIGIVALAQFVIGAALVFAARRGKSTDDATSSGT